MRVLSIVSGTAVGLLGVGAATSAPALALGEECGEMLASVERDASDGWRSIESQGIRFVIPENFRATVTEPNVIEVWNPWAYAYNECAKVFPTHNEGASPEYTVYTFDYGTTPLFEQVSSDNPFWGYYAPGLGGIDPGRIMVHFRGDTAWADGYVSFDVHSADTVPPYEAFWTAASIHTVD